MARRATPLGTLVYIHDLDGNVIAELSTTGATLREYVWVEHPETADADEAPGAAFPLAIISDIASGAPKLAFVLTDHQMREAVLTDITGAVIHDVLTTPFGALVSQTGSGAITSDAGFPGQRTLMEIGTNVSYNWHRH
jgi:hypothetical protein